MRSASKEIVLLKRSHQKTFGILHLPDQFIMGAGASTSKYRICEIVDGADLPTGTKVVVMEMGSHEIDGDLHRAPKENVLGYIKENGAFQPLLNCILVKPDPKEEKRGSILVPECSQAPSTTGTILAVGKDCKYPETKPGARILYSMFAGLEVSLDTEGDVLIIREEALKNHVDELLCFIEDSHE